MTAPLHSSVSTGNLHLFKVSPGEKRKQKIHGQVCVILQHNTPNFDTIEQVVPETCGPSQAILRVVFGTTDDFFFFLSKKSQVIQICLYFNHSNLRLDLILFKP